MYITKDIYVLHVFPVCKDDIIHLMTPSMTPVTSSPTPKSCTCQKARKEIGWETSPQVIRSQNGKTLEISGEIWLWTSKNHNVWLSETLLMSPDPGVERNCFIARVVVDTATSSAILSSRDFSRPRILHARAFQCTGSFGESKTRSTPWKTCYRYILGVSRCCFCLKNLKRLCLHFNPSTIEGCICFMSPRPSNWMAMSKFPAHPGVIAKSLPKHLNKNWWSTHCLVCRISQFHFPPWLELLTTQQQLLTCQFRHSKNSSCCAFHAAFQTHLLQIGCDAVLRSSSHLPLPLPNKPRNGPEWIHKTYTTWKGSMVAIPILEFELFL